MYSPISEGRPLRLLPAALLLAACSVEPAPKAGEEASGDGEGRIECAVAGSDMARDCTVERMQSPEGLVLMLRHRDGGFRRLLVTSDGRGVVPADGAEPAVVTVIADNRIEVAIAGERYRLPATVK